MSTAVLHKRHTSIKEIDKSAYKKLTKALEKTFGNAR